MSAQELLASPKRLALEAHKERIAHYEQLLKSMKAELPSFLAEAASEKAAMKKADKPPRKVAEGTMAWHAYVKHCRETQSERFPKGCKIASVATSIRDENKGAYDAFISKWKADQHVPARAAAPAPAAVVAVPRAPSPSGWAAAQKEQEGKDVEAPLPSGWFSALDEDGDKYYYTASGATQWSIPTKKAKKSKPAPAAAPVAAPAPAPAAAPETPIESLDRKVYQYLFDLQDSGVCNMLNSDQYLRRNFGISADAADEYVENYLSNYAALRKKYF